MVKKVKETTHFRGKHSGYELIDGVYHIAPMYTDSFAKLADRTIGVDGLVNSVVRHAAEINKEIACEQRILWERLYDDLDLDRSKRYHYKSSEGVIRVVEKAEQQNTNQ